MGTMNMDRSYYTKAILDALRSERDDSVRVSENGAISRDVTKVRDSESFNDVFDFDDLDSDYVRFPVQKSA